MNSNLNYYLWSSYRRKSIDFFQEKYKYYYKGVVLDIGGKDRGKFEKPKNRVEKWIFADIEEKHNPDIVLDVANMKKIEDESIDVVNAIELFEHVEFLENGLKECYRVLKKEGHMIISAPFLSPVHGDPYDYQRWTSYKWEKELNELGFKIIKIEKMGLFFSILADMLKLILRSIPVIKYLIFLYPLIDLIKKLDNTNFTRNSVPFKDYIQGYYIIVKK